MDFGILVGCDVNQEWLLPWWWENYVQHNNYPVAFVDMGLSPEGLAFCSLRGVVFTLKKGIDSLPREEISETIRAIWERRYSSGFYPVRQAWLKKPFAMLSSPFANTIWIDLDCQVCGSLEPLFNSLYLGAELGLVRDPDQSFEMLLPEEVLYNSGVIAFRSNAPVLQEWIRVTARMHHLLPSDQELLSRAIFLEKTNLIELDPVYNWSRLWGCNSNAIIRHFSGSLGKKEIQKMVRVRG